LFRQKLDIFYGSVNREFYGTVKFSLHLPGGGHNPARENKEGTRPTMNRRTEILLRAAELFAERGVSNTSIEHIANAVGVTREAIYYYFKSRHDILLEVLLPSSKELLAGMRNIRRSDMTSLEKMRAAFENHLIRFDPTYLEMSIALREHHFFADTTKLGQLQKSWTEYSNHWTELIQEGQDRGEFRQGVDAKMVAYGILGMCNWLSRWFDPAKDISIEEIIETYFTLTSNGLAVPAGEQVDLGTAVGDAAE